MPIKGLIMQRNTSFEELLVKIDKTITKTSEKLIGPWVELSYEKMKKKLLQF